MARGTMHVPSPTISAAAATRRRTPKRPSRDDDVRGPELAELTGGRTFSDQTLAWYDVWRKSHWRARCRKSRHCGFGPGPLEKDLSVGTSPAAYRYDAAHRAGDVTPLPYSRPLTWRMRRKPWSKRAGRL